jgi:hypothetical protein
MPLVTYAKQLVALDVRKTKRWLEREAKWGDRVDKSNPRYYADVLVVKKGDKLSPATKKRRV